MANRILILGSGFGAVYAYRELHKRLYGNTNVAITILSNKNYFLFSPMLHEVASGGLDQHDIVQPIREIIHCCVDAFVNCEVTGVLAAEKKVQTTRGEFNYDYLVVAVGANATFFNVPGAEGNALPLKTLEDARRIRSTLLHLLEQSLTVTDREERKRLLRWIIVGGGPTGVELSGELVELAESFARAAPAKTILEIDTQIHQAGDRILPMFGEKVQKIAAHTLEEKGITVHCNSVITDVTPEGVTLKNGEVIKAGTVLWTAGVVAVSLAFDDNLTDDRHRITVTPYLNIEKYPEIFALGDIANIKNVPQTAQAAVAEAKIVGRNIHALLNERPLSVFHFKQKGILVSLGQWRAAGTIGSITITGRFAWWLWRTIYLFKLIGIPNRIRVAVDWTLNLFFARDISEI
ncbi:hypothetical protein COV04_02435 [Candidatus Uhrbacteria bacterium CG10_big_fil_rev_8_21_14_0_10_48_11]|uniref:Uncharacterized protein n=1 Tax=Candidatus Uhrbacteria bacterium CG10_big_fil_rev_8_21_14_0_10_48_11 TaxID=1975037 RepID=A0A2M8LEA1_9BACT|nr:MAG: hypothetical protein COV04_02435 [Candidatus Uhrbacteria bacterium CG10_big_fil_rev_8_21_14_0_10_48_11]